MKPISILLRLAAACAPCCAAPAILPLLAIGAAGSAWASRQFGLVFAVVLLLAALAVVVARRRKTTACKSTACGCGGLEKGPS